MDCTANIKIVIAEDHQLFAEGLEKLLTGGDINCTVLAKVNNGKKLMQVLNGHTPDLILLDINMPFMDGLAASVEIRKKLPKVKIIIISMYSNHSIIEQCKKNGINGFIPKDTSLEVLKKTIQKVLDNQDIFLVKHSALQFVEPTGDMYALKCKLSPRQLEIIRLMNQGITANKDIANALIISVFTVETHLKNIYQILNISGKIELIRLSLKV